jgi:hypothetical protein
MTLTYGVSKQWAATTDAGRTHIATNGVNQSGLVLNIDVGSSSTYPGSGALLYDLEGNHNFTLTNGPTYSSSDNYGGIAFDGSNDYALVAGGIPLASPTSLTNNFTIEQVFKPTAYQASSYFGLTNMLLNKGSASTYNYATQVTADTTFSFIKRTSPESLQSHNFTVPSMLNKVNVVTLVIENGNNTSTDTASCYYNGAFISTLNIAGDAITANDNEPFYLGGLGNTQYTMLIGSYYSGRIYNRALTAAEISKNFQSVRYRFGL